jgi:hypothetical protein
VALNLKCRISACWKQTTIEQFLIEFVIPLDIEFKVQTMDIFPMGCCGYWLAVPTVISFSYHSSIDQLQELWELRVKWRWTILCHLSPFFTSTCVPRVLNMINYIFSSQWQLSNGKWLSLHQETRAYVMASPLGCCFHSYTQQPNGKRPNGKRPAAAAQIEHFRKSVADAAARVDWANSELVILSIESEVQDDDSPHQISEL